LNTLWWLAVVAAATAVAVEVLADFGRHQVFQSHQALLLLLLLALEAAVLVRQAVLEPAVGILYLAQ
jgi:hypothetical protein